MDISRFEIFHISVIIFKKKIYQNSVYLKTFFTNFKILKNNKICKIEHMNEKY